MSKKDDILKPIVSDTLNNERHTIKSEALRIAEAQLKSQLMLKKSIEFNASILTLVAQVSNTAAAGKSLKGKKLIESIKQINKEYMTSIEEIARG